MLKVGDKVILVSGEEGTIIEITKQITDTTLSIKTLYKVAIPTIYHTFVYPEEVTLIEG